jgi:hypothetical protein
MYSQLANVVAENELIQYCYESLQVWRMIERTHKTQARAKWTPIYWVRLNDSWQPANVARTNPAL